MKNENIVQVAIMIINVHTLPGISTQVIAYNIMYGCCHSH